MQPNRPQNSRQRPLQKSMFLPQSQQHINRTGHLDYQYQDMMKRSSINPDTAKINTFQFTSPSIQPQAPIHQFNTNSNPILNFNTNTRYKQTLRQPQFQQMPQSPVYSEFTIQQIQQKINQLLRMVENHDEILKQNNLIATKDKTSIAPELQEIEMRIKESLLPTMISRQTKEIYEHIFNFKLEIKSLKEEVIEINDKVKNEMAILLNGNSKSNSTLNSIEKLEKSEESFMDLGLNLASFQNRFSQMERDFSTKNEQLKGFILNEIEKGRQLGNVVKKQSELSNSSLKVKSSTIQSTLPPIVIEYLQIFGVRNQNQQNSSLVRTGTSIPRFQDDKEIVINSNSQNRYIVDVKGHQIKLDQKHLTLLKEHHVLS